jgi:DNA helicase II / ATP-dependent DNA helicase PcrA
MTLAPVMTEPGLDTDQEAVATAPASARCVVTAGPGAGKTWTLIERTRNLIAQGVEPAGGILILSFSRAAVETIASRGALQADLGRLPVRTFDSLATQMLIHCEASPEGKSYDERIAAAKRLLQRSRKARDFFEEIRHVLVDEAQDVVGPRASFVAELLRAVCRDRDVGFTIFGDPAQAIYDFQLSETKEARRLLTSPVLPETGAASRKLLRNYRMEPERLAPLALEFGEKIRNEPASEELHYDLRLEIQDDCAWSDVQDAAGELRTSCSATAAVLCRTNAEVLHIGALLMRKGVDLRVQHRAEDRGGAAWLADLFGSARFGKTRIPSPESHPEVPANLKFLLRQSGLASRDEVDLEKLARFLRLGVCPEGLTSRTHRGVVVSTIHRAKGLEFDSVYVVDNRRRPDPETLSEEIKVLYVAATRARTHLLGAAEVEFDGYARQAKDRNRATLCHWRKKWPYAVEVRVSDSDSNWHPDDPQEFSDMQEYLRRVRPGDPVRLALDPPATGAFPSYSVIHTDAAGTDACIGRTNARFALAVDSCTWGDLPKELTNLVAEQPDTAAFERETAQRLGLGPHGLHLRGRFYGLGKMHW